jgi:hypothetical protein
METNNDSDEPDITDEPVTVIRWRKWETIFKTLFYAATLFGMIYAALITVLG